MAGVFLSYSSQDRERVALLAEGLRAEGFEVWWDREIPVAVTYEDYIRQQLDSAGAVVVVWSSESVASRYVRWEVRRAERRGVLVPVLIEEADLPPEYFLVQSADLTRWTGDRSDREWRRLVTALVRLVGEPVRPEVAEEKPAAAPLPAEVPAQVIPASELMLPEAAPVVEEAAALEEAAAPPAAITAEPSAVELEPVPEEAIPIVEAAEGEPAEAEPASEKEEVVEGSAVLAETEVEESLRAWEPVSEEGLVVTEAVGEVLGEAPEAAVGRHRPPPWYRRRWVLGTAGGLLAAFVAIALVVRPRGGGEEAVTTLPASTTEAVSTSGATVAPTTTAAPTTTTPPDVPDMTWARLPVNDVFMPPSGWGVAWGSGRVAVGSDGSGGDEDAAVYITTDGVTWERVPHDEAVFGGPGDQQMRAVAVGGPGLVAVGRDGYDGAVWTSADGLTWERIADERGVFARPREVWGVTAGGPGLVAVGFSGFENRAMVWTSTDGVTWLATILNSEGGMMSVTVGGPGLVAVGWDYNAWWESHAAVWTSTDGIAWERVPHDAAVFGGHRYEQQQMTAVVAGGPGLVAVGLDNSSGAGWDAAVWKSIDGLTWEGAAHDEALFGGPGDQTMQWLAVVEGLGLVAWGEDSSTPEGKGIWVSPPVAGLEWQRVAKGSVDVCPGCAVLGDLEVQVGVDESGGDPDAAVWTQAAGQDWEPVPHDEAVFGGPGKQVMEAVTAGGPGLVAVGYDQPGMDGDDDAAVWTSVDGITWERVPHDEAVFGGDGNQEMSDVVAGGPGLIAVGYDGGGDGDAAVWASADGLTWERVPDQESVLGGPGDQHMGAVVATASALVAVGHENTTSDSNAVVWTSVDGFTWERVPDPGSVFGDPDSTYQDMVDVEVGGPGLVAVGSDRSGGDSDAAVWVSVGGFTWIRVPHDEAVFGGPGDQGMGAVVATDSGLVAELWDGESGLFLVSPPPG